LIGAIRLPNTAFKANAGTEVTTDIVFLQKHGRGVAASAEVWPELAPIETLEGPILINEYFVRHPEMMLGQMRLEGKMYRGGEPSLVLIWYPRQQTGDPRKGKPATTGLPSKVTFVNDRLTAIEK
jgi:hypothetical protein